MSTANLPIALYSAAEVRELDRAAIERGVPGYELMCRAGAATVGVLRRTWPAAPHIAVLVGAGNNGGDGYVIARLLANQGLRVGLWTLADPDKLQGDAARARDDALALGLATRPFGPEALKGADVVVDALLGTGLERPVTGPWADAIAAVNDSAVPVLAVDIPSGLQADTGRVMGAAIAAAATVTFIGLKRGLFTGRGPALCGSVHFDDLQVPPDIYSEVRSSAARYCGEDRPQLLPPRPRDAHKGHHGHVLVVGGDHGMAGAVRMAGEAAARVGAGLVSVATRESHAGVQAAIRPELMFRGVESPDALGPLLQRADVIALGPGLGRAEWGRTLWQLAVASHQPLVVDADALNILAQSQDRARRWVLTPHPGEAARLLECSVGEVEADRFAAAAAICERYRGVCVLKGAGTIVHGPDEPPAVVQGGNPGMASGGMGDVLTGIIAGLLAQGLGFTAAARLGAWVHAAAGDRAAAAGERGLLALDLVAELRRLVNPA